MPALYVSNPRDSKGRFKKARKAGSTSHAAKPKRRKKRNPAQQQQMFAAPAKPQRRRRKSTGRTTSPTPRKRAASKRRAARPRIARGWSYQKNPRGRGGRFVARRRGGGRKRNALSISNPVGKIPVLGTAVAMLGPAFFAAVGVELIGQVIKFVTRSWQPPEAVMSVAYTLGGLILAGIVQLFTFIPAPIRHAIGVGLASGGGAVDWYRYRSASGAYGALEMGDGGEWEVQELSDTEAFGELEMSGLDFSGDEDYCGLDFSMAEGEAMAEGYGAYLKKFPLKKHPKARQMARRPDKNTPIQQIHDPRREGDRWHWLTTVVDGPEDLKTLANMPPQRRLEQIQACKEACKAVLRNPQTFSPRPQRQLVERMPHEVPIGARPPAPAASRDPYASNSFV